MLRQQDHFELSGGGMMTWKGRDRDVHLDASILLQQSEMERRDTMPLSCTELLELLELRGERSDYELALQPHFTFPLANLLLQMLVLPFALRFERTRRVESVLAAILMCGSYLLTDLTCRNLVYRGSMHAVAGAWTPTTMFGSLAVVVFGSARS